MKQRVLLAVSGALAIGWQTTIHTTAAAVGPDVPSISVHGNGITAAVGAGHYLLQGAFDVQFAFVAIQLGNGRAIGQFRHRTEDENGSIDFRGEVTCLAVDSENRRAWVGGVIVANRSENPNYNTAPQHQVGHDIWFRVLDSDQRGDGDDESDRSTFVGFEGVIPSSEAYCRDRIWPDGNARTWPVTSGNLIVHP